MGKKIFSDNAHRYFELGIPVIPLGGKVPLVSGWQEWSTRAQTEDEVESLVEQFPAANIGAVLGLWASALDIDTDSDPVLKAVPYSPIRRRGAKGIVALFRPCALPNKPGTEFPIEFLNHGRQIVLPPSIHPDTGTPYMWIGEEDISSFKDLPQLSNLQIANLERVCAREGIRTPQRAPRLDGTHPVSLTDMGRNNRLTRIAYAMACDEVVEDEAVDRLISSDSKEHDIPWFTDPSEPHKGRNPRNTASRMYKRAVASAKKRGHRNGELVITINQALPPSKVPNPVPRPRGFIKLFQDYCNAISVGNQDALGLGGGIALMAALASNRYRTEAGSFEVYPNMFLLNLAHSGFGKETPQRAIDELLMNTELLGSASYKSGTSIVMGLPKQPERLDVIDECAMLLKAMCSQEDYKSEIVDILSSLYTKSNSRFLGFASRADGPRFGACWNPCVNILGSTTPQGFRSSVSKDMAAKGLMPRFLVFWQKDVGEFKPDFDADMCSSLKKELLRLTNVFLSTDKPDHPDAGQVNLLEPEAESQPRYLPHIIAMTDMATKAWREIYRAYYEEGRRDPESFESAFKNRFAQHVSKLALLDTLSQGLAEIEVDSIEWAHSVVKWQWETVKELYELASAENEHEKDLLRVLQYIKQQGTASKRQITRRFQGIWTQKLDGILKQLEDGGDVEKGRDSEIDKPGPKATLYRHVAK